MPCSLSLFLTWLRLRVCASEHVVTRKMLVIYIAAVAFFGPREKEWRSTVLVGVWTHHVFVDAVGGIRCSAQEHDLLLCCETAYGR